METKYLVLSIFIAAYVCFIFLPTKRTICACIGSLAMIVFGQFGFVKAFWFVDWNVMGLLVGMFFIADAFMVSNVPAYLAEQILYKIKRAVWGILAICFLTGFISAFVENVAALLVVAPIALALAEKIKIKPTIFLIALAISSNLQGMATLTGDPPSMLLASFMNLTFSDFFFYKGKMGLFFTVQIGAVASLVVLYFLFKKKQQKVYIEKKEKVFSWTPTWILIGVILVLAFTSFFHFEFKYLTGLICMIGGGVSLFWLIGNNKKSFFCSMKELDWHTTVFLIAVFILVGALKEANWLIVFANNFSGWVGTNQLLGYVSLILFAVVMSAVIDNVPFLVAMLPVVKTLVVTGGFSPQLFFFGLLIGSCLGGNITPIGASANIVAVGILKKNGCNVSFWEFVRVGLPFSLAAVISAALFNWWLWA